MEHSFVARNGRHNALAQFSELTTRGIAFGPNAYRIGHLVLRGHFAVPRSRPVKVTVKVKLPSQAIFKRHRFEERIMELLRRNGFCREREPGAVAAAAD